MRFNVTMDCNKEDAVRAKEIAEEKMKANDFVGAYKFVIKAQRLFANLENITQMIAICEVHCSAAKKIKGLDNWYSVLNVQPFADADTIRKQYRKLVFLLHPDKNKFAGAEAAFKLVGEAKRLLSDKIKRSQYDIRYRSHSLFANKHVNANSTRGGRSAAANNSVENIASVYTFWTCCRHCGHWYKYLREYMNTVMHCSSCRKSYFACNMGCGGVPTSSSTTDKKQFQDQEMCNTSWQNSSTGARSGNSAAKMDKNGTVRRKLNEMNQEHEKKGVGGTEGGRPQNVETVTNNPVEIRKADVLKPQHEVKEPDTSAAKSIPDISAPKKNQAAKKRRRTVEESSKSFEVGSSDVDGAETDTNEYNSRKSSRKKPQVSYTESRRDGDFVSPPNKKTKSGCEDTKKSANSGNEDILLAKNKESKSCDGNGEDAAFSNKIDRVENGYKANENPITLDIPDPEFNVFEVERKIENFAVNQVWSTIDSRDSKPRKYVRVKKVLNAEFKLRVTNLEPIRDKNDESIPVACGKFKNGTTEEVKDLSIFSVQMHHSLCNRTVSIYPSKGEVWAIFRERNTSLKNYKYDFVEILTDFHNVDGLGVAYLGKLEGSVSLFHWEAQHGIFQIQFTPKQMVRFSHKVPAVKMTGEEKELVPANSYVLDSAALPKDIFQVDMKTSSEIFKGKADGPYPETPKVKEKRHEETICRNSSEMEEETARNTRDLALILDKIEKSGKQLAALDEQLESRRRLLKIQSLELVSKEKELGCVRDQCDSIKLFIQGLSEELVAREMELACVVESSNHFKFDIEVKEKRVQALNNKIKISGEQLDLKSKELGEIERELELKKRLRQMSTVLVNHEKQPAETEPFNEDTLTHDTFSASLTRHEVSTVLRALPNPAEFVLGEVQDYISEEFGLQDSVLEILVLFFEELTEIQRPDDPQLQDKATQVATLWKRKITIEAPQSSLEVLAFLLFIVAYGLKKLINEEETALLASSIAHCQQAPSLFKSLSLSCEIQKFVKELIKKSQYIPAVRLICLFKLNEEFSPSHLLELEIISLRQSVLEKRPTESSQVKDKDAGRLRAILELVADYKLNINLPGDLIAKLMIQRENSAPPLSINLFI